MTTNEPDELEVFRLLLDSRNWPMRRGKYLIVQGEVYQFVSDDPLEERVFKPLFRGKFQ